MKMKSNLFQLMAKKDVRFSNVSRATGIDRNFLSKLANGKVKEIKTEHLMKLKKYFDNCPIQEIIDFELEESDLAS